MTRNEFLKLAERTMDTLFETYRENIDPTARTLDCYLLELDTGLRGTHIMAISHDGERITDDIYKDMKEVVA